MRVVAWAEEVKLEKSVLIRRTLRPNYKTSLFVRLVQNVLLLVGLTSSYLVGTWRV
jgi:hypothetical protein